jgi:hypothetical protein
MEQNKIIIIALVSAVIGGLIGGGVTYYLLMPVINDIYSSYNEFENNFDLRTTQILEDTESIRNVIDSISIHIDQIESLLDNLSINFRIMNNDVEQVKNKPSNHLIYVEDYLPSMNATISEYPESFVTKSFEVKGNITTIQYHLQIWDSDWGHHVSGIIMLNNEAGDLITTYSLNADSSSEYFVGEFPVKLNPGVYSIEVIAGLPEVYKYKITSYAIMVWDYY